MRRAMMAAVVAMTAGAARGGEKNLIPGDTEQFEPFTMRFEGGKLAKKTGQNPSPWTAGAWHKSTTGELRLGPDPVTGTKAFGLVNIEGKPSMMLRQWRGVGVKPGRLVKVAMDVLTAGDGRGVLKFPKPDVRVPIEATEGTWRRIEATVPTGSRKALGFEVHNFGRGADSGLYVKDVSVTDAGPDPDADARAAAGGAPPPDTAAWKRAGGYYAALRADLEKLGLPAGEFLFGASEAEAFKRFRKYGQTHDRATLERLEPDASLPFAHGARMEVLRQTPHYWSVVFGAGEVGRPVAKGDVALIVAYLRSGGSREANIVGGRVEVKDSGRGRLAETIGGKYTPEPEWKRYHIPVRFRRANAGTWKVEFFMGGPTQVIEIGGGAVIYYGRTVDLADLPRTKFDYNYPGRAADAPWRQAAGERIEKLRKADLRVVVTGADGKPVEGAKVTAEMTCHEFLWGNIGHTSITPDETAEARKLREMILENFNALTIGTFKWGPWRGRWGEKFTPDRTLKVLAWAKKQGLPVHGHTPIWHQFGVMPFDPDKDGKEAIRAGILKWLNDLLTIPAVRDGVDSWDAINHPFGYSRVWRHVGKDIMLEELAAYRRVVPEAKLFVNEGGVMVRGGTAYPRYREYIGWLMENKAPLDGVGFMCHFDVSSITPPEELLRRLDDFAGLDANYPDYDLELKITEFDVSAVWDDANQVAAQADYTRDLLTACFSHPDVGSVVQWGFWAGRMWKKNAALYTEDWTLRPNGKVYRELVFGEWWTDEAGRTDAAGAWATRGFRGNYRITVEAGGKKRSVQARLTKDAPPVEVRLSR